MNNGQRMGNYGSLDRRANWTLTTTADINVHPWQLLLVRVIPPSGTCLAAVVRCGVGIVAPAQRADGAGGQSGEIRKGKKQRGKRKRDNQFKMRALAISPLCISLAAAMIKGKKGFAQERERKKEDREHSATWSSHAPPTLSKSVFVVRGVRRAKTACDV